MPSASLLTWNGDRTNRLNGIDAQYAAVKEEIATNGDFPCIACTGCLRIATRGDR